MDHVGACGHPLREMAAVCTILFLNHVHPDYPLIIAANRDERYDRPARSPHLISRAPAALAGLDELAGGSWMGVNAVGIAVGITNHRTYMAPDPEARSRGDIVRDALSARTLDELAWRLGEVDCRQYNPFNLLFGDAGRVRLAYARPDTRAIEIVDAPTGVHVLPNDRLGAEGFPKAARAVRLATAIATRPWPELAQGLGEILGDHALPELSEIDAPPAGSVFSVELLHRHQAICIHGDGYGTRSSTVMALGVGGVDHYLFSDGPPCTTRFVEYAQLLQGQD